MQILKLSIETGSSPAAGSDAVRRRDRCRPWRIDWCRPRRIDWCRPRHIEGTTRHVERLYLGRHLDPHLRWLGIQERAQRLQTFHDPLQPTLVLTEPIFVFLHLNM